jgi:acyl-CoA synthetase (AMP-forming)/AMP-acid ligase II
VRYEKRSGTLVDYSMSYAPPADHTAAVAAALAELGVRAGDRVLIMLPDGPGFAEAFAGTITHGAVPLPADPLLPAHGIVTVAGDADARLVLVSADRVPALADLAAEPPPVLVDGPRGPWAAALRLRSREALPR